VLHCVLAGKRLLSVRETLYPSSRHPGCLCVYACFIFILTEVVKAVRVYTYLSTKYILRWYFCAGSVCCYHRCYKSADSTKRIIVLLRPSFSMVFTINLRLKNSQTNAARWESAIVR